MVAGPYPVAPDHEKNNGTVASAKLIRRFFFMKTSQQLNRDFVTSDAISE